MKSNKNSLWRCKLETVQRSGFGEVTRRDTFACIVTGYELDGCGSIPGNGKVFLFFIASRPALRPTQPPGQWVPGAVSVEVKQPWHEADHSTPSGAEVDGGAMPSLPLMLSWHVLNQFNTGTTLLLPFTLLL
jgi:hypothetical protein